MLWQQSCNEFNPKKYTWYSFLLEAESIPGPLCDRKFQWHHQESNPRPVCLLRSKIKYVGRINIPDTYISNVYKRTSSNGNVCTTTNYCLAFALLDSSLDLSGVCWWRCYIFKTGTTSWHEPLVNFHKLRDTTTKKTQGLIFITTFLLLQIARSEGLFSLTPFLIQNGFKHHDLLNVLW